MTQLSRPDHTVRSYPSAPYNHLPVAELAGYVDPPAENHQLTGCLAEDAHLTALAKLYGCPRELHETDDFLRARLKHVLTPSAPAHGPTADLLSEHPLVASLQTRLREAHLDLDYVRREAYELDLLARYYRRQADTPKPLLSSGWHHLAEFVDPVTDGWVRPPDPEETVLRNAFRPHGGDRRMIGR